MCTSMLTTTLFQLHSQPMRLPLRKGQRRWGMFHNRVLLRQKEERGCVGVRKTEATLDCFGE